MIITIDGPIATGKSSIAKRLSREIGFIYFDTGAMYRSFAYAAKKHAIDLGNKEILQDFLKKFNFDIKIKQGERLYFVDGEDVTLKIRTDEITSYASQIATIPEVREKLVALQRELAEGVNAVFEGRDMGSVVFPNAQLKIFLTGNDEIRAKRRYEELIVKFPELAETWTVEKVLHDLKERDTQDTTRAISPLKQAPDAYVIDTSVLSLDEVVSKILEIRAMLKTKK